MGDVPVEMASVLLSSDFRRALLRNGFELEPCCASVCFGPIYRVQRTGCSTSSEDEAMQAACGPTLDVYFVANLDQPENIPITYESCIAFHKGIVLHRSSILNRY